MPSVAQRNVTLNENERKAIRLQNKKEERKIIIKQENVSMRQRARAILAIR